MTQEYNVKQTRSAIAGAVRAPIIKAARRIIKIIILKRRCKWELEKTVGKRQL